MNERDIEKRLEEERLEADGWADVLVKFSARQFSELHCPHCGKQRQFEYLVHENGFTVRCKVCLRFVHGSGGLPAWLEDRELSTDSYRPIPED